MRRMLFILVWPLEGGPGTEGMCCLFACMRWHARSSVPCSTLGQCNFSFWGVSESRSRVGRKVPHTKARTISDGTSA